MGSPVRLLAWMCLPLLLVEITCALHGSLVKVNKGLKVKRGQSAYLHVEDLQFHIPHQKDSCKLEVVVNEPITQRVGKLVPQVFDCDYLADEVKYVHNGCPLLTEDTVKLRLYRFTETETYMEVFAIHVEIMEPECTIIRLGPKSLEVPEFYSLSNAVDGNVVSFHYESRSSLDCSIHLNSHDTHLPTHGQLVTGEPEKATRRGDEPETFIHLRQQLDNKARATCRSEDCLKGLKLVKLTKVSCEDFLVMGLRYQHTDPPSPHVDYIAVRLDLKDTRSGSIYQSEQAWIPVQITGAMPNQPPTPAYMSTFVLEVDQFILTPLSTATLDADDEETPKQLLVFNVTTPPQDGFITHLSDHTRPVSSFTWLDLNDMLIGYQPANFSHNQRRNYEVEFEVHDFYFEKSPPLTVHMSQDKHRDESTVRGTKGFMFTVNDIKGGVVCYHHDDSDSTKDFIIFRITDGHHQTRHKFPIKILPKDDTPPFLITNMLLEVPEGHTALLRGSILQASDMDSSDDYILFNITRPPQSGEVMKIPGPGKTGYPVSHFLQKDLSQSKVYYRHLGHEVSDDWFEVVLSDFHDPPNLSEAQVVMVHVEPVPDKPPKEVPGSSRSLVLKETDVVHITRQQLHFVDQQSADRELTFTVTTPPFYSRPHSNPDAGRLFLVDSIPKFTKDANAPMLRVFTQHAVNFMKVAYMPPIMDIGPHPQQVQFVLSVTNHRGKTVTGICFNITVEPVDNQPPQVVSKPLTVDEGGECRLGPEHLLLSDEDSSEEALRVELQREPQHGALHLSGLLMKPGQSFTLQDLQSHNVRYSHDSSETTQDNIEFTATDGTSSVIFVLQVMVKPINDEVPVVGAGLKAGLSCAEGQEIVLTAEYIYATDRDSDNSSLYFLIVQQPHHGVVLREGAAVDRFIQADITAGIVTYKHTGANRERVIGLAPRHDTVTFVISDGETETLALCCSGGSPVRTSSTAHLRQTLPVYDLQITVFPVDSQPPTLETRELNEGGTAPITAAHLKASDVDTVLDELVISLTSPPQFGYIENVLPSPGFEKSNTGVSTGERLAVRSCQLCAVQTSEGGFLSTLVDHSTHDCSLNMVITSVYVKVHEGQMKRLDSSVLHATDLDIPKNVLLFSVATPPRHGSIIAHSSGEREKREAQHQLPVVAFTVEDLINAVGVVYVHDDSESVEDSFTIQLTDGRHHVLKQVTVKVLQVNDEKPQLIRNAGLDVDPGDSRLISSASLFAQDRDTPPSELMYMFESVPTQGLLQLKGWVTLAAGKNCTQEMVDMNLLRYVNTGRRAAQSQDFFVFHLLDGKNQSPSQHFQISIKDQDKGNIVIFVNPANVSRGDRIVLTTHVLQATDGTDQPEELLYVITSPPAHGHIEYMKHPGIIISTFSQMDIAANLVAYVHDNRASTPKETFQPLDKSPPEVVKVLPLWKAEPLADGRYGIFLSSQELKARDSNSREEELIFCIVRPPHFGFLENITTGGFVPQRFLQMELKKRSIVYIISLDTESVSDSLEFTVSDLLGNTGPRHLLEFRWSRVELLQTETSACEEQGTISLDIVRRGNLAVSSYISVKVNEVTATAGKDFLTNPSALVQFDPGMCLICTYWTFCCSTHCEVRCILLWSSTIICVNVCGSQTTAGNPVHKPCVPGLRGLLHFNQATNELFHCNGVSWKAWAPTDQVLQLHNTNTSQAPVTTRGN
uniref:Fras1 related extracellular matrix 1a n=1 Tax=Haplochromis burtoni TaxID=8153 RepID=A0A3Q2V9Z3_HAPBU